MRLPAAAVSAICAFFAAATPAYAVIETWVSGTGTDASNCPRSAPCRTFAYALTKTNSGGTINVATPGSFGPVTINKSVSIVADGVEALISIAAGQGAAVTVAAGASHVVSLRGLTIDGDVRVPDSEDYGIDFQSGGALHVHNCIMRGTSRGINLLREGGSSELYLVDSVISDPFAVGINIETANAGLNVTLERVRVERATVGIFMNGPNNSIAATILDSVFAGNSVFGIAAGHSGSGSAQVMIDRTLVVHNRQGIFIVGGATARIGNSTITGNVQEGLFNSSGTIESYGTNKVDGNGTDTSGTITAIDTK